MMDEFFTDWLYELCKQYEKRYGPNTLALKEAQSWEDYYLDGFSPNEALDDEATYD